MHLSSYVLDQIQPFLDGHLGLAQWLTENMTTTNIQVFACNSNNNHL